MAPVWRGRLGGTHHDHADYRGHGSRLARRGLVLAGALVVLLGTMGLAACGGQGVVGGGNQNCGKVHSAGGGSLTRGTASTIDCFAQAYAHCQPATLVFSAMGVDTVETHTFTIQPGNGGKCGISDSASFYQASGNRTTTQSYQCASLRQSAGGLVIEQCGTLGSLVIPAPDGTPAP